MARLLLKTALAGFFGFFLLLVAGLWYHWAAYLQPPEQPIAFAHSVHAGRLKLPCTFCHILATDSRRAGVPSLERCLSCHRTVATDREEIIRLRAYYENERPVEWVRVHSLPDFILFSHKRHLRRGIDCSACHGDLSAMERVRRVRPLNMGWCVACHRGKGASTDCAGCHK